MLGQQSTQERASLGTAILHTEAAHPEVMSTFETDEHLQQDTGCSWTTLRCYFRERVVNQELWGLHENVQNPRFVRSAGQASADGGSLSGRRNGATAWRHSGHLREV
jgi:hypothetical protein